MTNELMLREAIKKCGFKMQFVAKSVGLSYPGFLNKMTGRSEFNAPEIMKLCKLLNLERNEMDAIFFVEKVDETSTKEGE